MKSLATAAAALIVSLAWGEAAAATFTVINSNDSGDGSLRWAIQQASTAPGTDRITFNIPGEGVHTIQLLTELPVILTPVAIDATTQPGYQPYPQLPGTPLVQLDGTLVTDPSDSGLRFYAPAHGSSVRGLSIGNFSYTGILLSAVDACTLASNHMGCDASGTVARPNLSGIEVNAGTGNVIGGGRVRDRNVISGNTFMGVACNAADGVKIRGNYIGTNASGLTALPNGADGVTVNGKFNVVGGTADGDRNLISGNLQNGIFVDGITWQMGEGCLIAGNWIGVNAYGTGSLPNARDGIEMNARYSTVGLPEAPNVVSGNSRFGMAVHGLSNVVQHNFIGTTFDGTRPLGNGSTGIFMGGSGHQITRNVIGSNSGHGIEGIVFQSPMDISIRGNFIGTNASGARNLGNGQTGIVMQTNNHFIGGPGSEDGNVIAFNARGVVVYGGTGVSLRRNRVYQNVQLDIDLEDDGITPNDPGDGDTGSNHLQNFPVISSVTYTGGQLSIIGSLQTQPDKSVIVDLFSSPTCHASGNGGGETWVASVPGTSDGSGVMNFQHHVSGPPQNVAGYYFTATATVPEADGIHSSTSEFSPCAVLAPSVAVEPPAEAPARFALGPPMPQPARGTVRVPFALERASRVRLDVFDVAGRRVASLLDEIREAGRQEIPWNVSSLPPGAYRLRLEAVAPDGSGTPSIDSRSVVVVH